MRATATQALHLQLKEGDPLLRPTSVNADDQGQQVEFGRTWFAGDRINDSFVTCTMQEGAALGCSARGGAVVPKRAPRLS